jgi:PTH1 family peptidyl-tRNA hydrolase
MTWLVVGLGNPGQAYNLTRHNIGFMLVDLIAELCGVSSFKNKFSAEIADCVIDDYKMILAKPLTYMNNSGNAVRAIADYYKIAPSNILVVHDDLDIPLGKLKMKIGGGAGGHNGLRSIDSCLGTNNYWRLRLGIGHPGDKSMVSDYVLSNFKRAELSELKPYLEVISSNLGTFFKQGSEAFIKKII